MRWGTRFLLTSALLLLAACTRTVVVRQPAPDRQPRGSRPPPRTPPEPDRPPPADNPPPVRTYEVLIPPGHLPNPGECRVWIQGTPPGRQPRPRSRTCAGIESVAPAGSWIVYRRADDQRLVYIRVVDARRPGIVVRNRIFIADTWELVREEDPQDERRGDDRPRQERPRDERPQPPPVQPPVQPPTQPPPVVQPPTGNRPAEPKPPESRPPEPRAPEQRPPEQRPLPRPEIIRPIQRDTNQPPPAQPPPPVQPPPVQPPPVQPPPPPSSTVTFKIPPGHLPEIGECRVWIERLPPGQQPRPKSRSCDGIASVAPAGSWILYRPSDDRNVIHVRLIDPRRAGVVIRIQIFDLDSKRLLREENP